MTKQRRRGSRLAKKAAKGSRGFPVGTVAFYGPDNRRASKVAVGVVPHEGAEVSRLRRWFSDDTDVRDDPEICQKIVDFFEQAGVRSVAMADGIMGCPHEEGADYPKGEACPQCPFWANRDRFTHEEIQ